MSELQNEIEEFMRQLAPHVKERKAAILLNRALIELKGLYEQPIDCEATSVRDHRVISSVSLIGFLSRQDVEVVTLCADDADERRVVVRNIADDFSGEADNIASAARAAILSERRMRRARRKDH